MCTQLLKWCGRWSVSIVLICFTSFLNKINAQSDNPYHINGNASQENCNCYTLTKDQTSQSGSVWNINKIDLTQSFDYHFNVFLGCRDSMGADGIAFVLQPISTSVGSTGEGLGVEGVSPSVVIAIDTYQNTNKGDPAYDHLAIHLNGDLDHSTANNIAGPVQALANSDNIEDCQWHVFRIAWDAVGKKITVYMDGAERLSASIDLVQNVFLNDPEVFWGFTGATGGGTNHQRFCTSLNASFSFPPGQITCYPQPIYFQDSSTSFGSVVKWYWDFGDGTKDTVEIPHPHVYTQPGNYTVKLNILGNNGCVSDTFQQQVVSGSKPIANFDFKQAPYCDDKLIPFNDLSEVEFGTINEWKWTVNGYNVTVNESAFQQQLPPGINTISLVVKTKEGCVSESTAKSITIEQHPEINITGDTEGCKNELLSYASGNTNSSVPINEWHWIFGDGNAGTSSATLHAFKDTGTYTIQVYALAQNGCPSDTLQTHTSIFGTYANAGADTIVAIGQPLQLQASGGKYYNWSPASGLNNPHIANPVAVLDKNTSFMVTASYDAGCPTSDTMLVKVYKGPELYVPSAFTPNGDYKNDVFRFTAAGMTAINYFKVFNRYGKVVYSSNNPQQGWDGTINNKPQAADTYVWMIEGKDYLGNAVKRKGTVTLIR